MSDINHPDIFWPALFRLIGDVPETSPIARKVSGLLQHGESIDRLLAGATDAPTADYWQALRDHARDMSREATEQHDPLFDRLDQFSGKAGLAAAEKQLLRLAVKLTQSEMCRSLASLMTDELEWPADRMIAVMSGIERQVIRSTLTPVSPLYRAGILELGSGYRSKSQEMSLILGDRLIRALSFDGDLVDAIVPCSQALDTEWSDFDHIGPARDFALPLLRGAVADRARGVNILLYGPPGTGKTQLAHLLSAELDLELRAICVEDDYGQEPSRQERLYNLRLAQTLFRDTPGTVILFDEAEDVMPALRFFDRDRGSKVHQNKMFEDNPVPVLWTTNDTEGMPESVRRRISFSIEMRLPPAMVRGRIFGCQTARQGLELPADQIERIAREHPVAPAVMATALKAAAMTGGGAADVEMALARSRQLIEGKSGSLPRSATGFDPALTSADLDLMSLADRLREAGHRPVSFCLSGLPGTGKSAFARHLAEQMGLEVIEKRASDMLSKWVGESEKNIAAAFAEAREASALLIFDEADSLLGSRVSAERRWEISQVNEMLTWMESHPLPFACTTNMADRLDPASLRRFTFKVEFQPLSVLQRRLAFQRFYGQEAPAALDNLEQLTPGDFACVARRLDWLPDGGPDGLLCELQRELSARGEVPRRIGFVLN